MRLSLTHIFGAMPTDKRTMLIKKNIIVSFIFKLWSILVLFIMVPITLDCLGVYTNGVWLTISSMLIWIDSLDIGLGRGLQNKLAINLANDNREGARKVVSNTFFMLFIIILPVMVFLDVAVCNWDVYSLLNVDILQVPDLVNALIASISFVCATFIFKFIGNFYMGLQLPAMTNIIQSVGQTIMLIATIIAFHSGYHSLLVIAIINTVSPLLTLICLYPYTLFYKYKDLAPRLSDFSLQISRSLFTLGAKFFILQIAGAIFFLTSNILISKILSPSEVTPYQIAYRYFLLITIAFNIICTPFWSATSDAYERGDLQWISSSRKKMNAIIILMIVLACIMTLGSPFVYNIWIGDKAIVPFSITIFEALYVVVMNWSLSYSFFINGTGKLFLQIIFTVPSALLFIPLVYLLTQYWTSVNCIIFVMIILMLPGLVCNAIQFSKIVNSKASGIWNK